MDIKLSDRDGFSLSVEIVPECEGRMIWEEHDGHGPVSDWRRPRYDGRHDKRPGELMLCGGFNEQAMFYDFAEACRIARRDNWGASPYRLDTEHGANGLRRVNAQWFVGRELLAFVSPWCDDLNAAISDVYDQFRQTFPSARAYAAYAARQDFERCQKWAEGELYFCGVVVKASRNGHDLGTASLWGIESDSGDYFAEVAEELVSEAVETAKAELAALCGCGQ